MIFLIAAALLGFAAGRVHRRRAAPDKAPKPICPCEHSVVFHVDGTGGCRDQVRRRQWRTAGVPVIAYVYVPCNCQMYGGTELLPFRGAAFREIARTEDQG